MTAILCCLKSCDVNYSCAKLAYNLRKIRLVVLLHLLLVLAGFLYLLREVRLNMHSLLLLSFNSHSSLDSLTALFKYLPWEKPGCTFHQSEWGWTQASRNYLCWSIVRILMSKE